MDEHVSKYNNYRIRISYVVLNHEKKIKLLRGFEKGLNNKRYMRNVAIMVNDQLVTSTIADSMLLKEELALFNHGDIQNKYFFPLSRILSEKKVNSLVLTLSDNKKIYISRSEARAIISLWNLAMHGYSFARLLEFEKVHTLETWKVILES